MKFGLQVTKPEPAVQRRQHVSQGVHPESRRLKLTDVWFHAQRGAADVLAAHEWRMGEEYHEARGF